MKFIHWLKGRLSSRYRAMSLYRRGMAHAQQHEHTQAVADYSLVIDMVEAPADLRGMAMYNRALVYDAMGNAAGAITDLNRVLTLSGVAEQVRIEARRKLTRMDRSQARSGNE